MLAHWVDVGLVRVYLILDNSRLATTLSRLLSKSFTSNTRVHGRVLPSIFISLNLNPESLQE